MLTPLDIKIALLRRGISGAQIARQVGVSRPLIYMTIKGQRRSPRVRRAIARAVGKRVSDLWPPDRREAA